MKNEHFFQANSINELAQEEKSQGRTYTTRLAQKQGNRNTGDTLYSDYSTTGHSNTGHTHKLVTQMPGFQIVKKKYYIFYQKKLLN